MTEVPQSGIMSDLDCIQVNLVAADIVGSCFRGDETFGRHIELTESVIISLHFRGWRLAFEEIDDALCGDARHVFTDRYAS